MEKLNVKRLREQAVAERRAEFKAAKTTEKKHHARLALQRALWEKGD